MAVSLINQQKRKGINRTVDGKATRTLRSKEVTEFHFFAVWPGRITPSITEELVSNQDILATLAALVGTAIPSDQAMDSNNLLPLLTGEEIFQKEISFFSKPARSVRSWFEKCPTN